MNFLDSIVKQQSQDEVHIIQIEVYIANEFEEQSRTFGLPNSSKPSPKDQTVLKKLQALWLCKSLYNTL